MKRKVHENTDTGIWIYSTVINKLCTNHYQYNTESSLFILNFKQCAYMPVSGIYKGPN